MLSFYHDDKAGCRHVMPDAAGRYLSFCSLSASSLLRRAAALAACFSVPSMIFSVTKSLPAEVDGLNNILTGCADPKGGVEI